MIKFSAAIVCLFAMSWLALGQSGLSLRGTVVDPTGAAVPGATVHVQTRKGAVVSEGVSDERGGFAFLNLRLGAYVVEVDAALGFAAQSMAVNLSGDVVGLKITMGKETVVQTVTINADPPLSTESSANRDTIAVTGEELRKLPVFDQNYIAALSPFLDSSAGGATLVVDGVEMKSAGVSASAIQEVRINNDPYSVEFSRPGRGRIEITTKPGSPEYHGEANSTFRDAVFNAKNHFAELRPPEVRRLLEGHFTGPVGKGGHTTFIASGEYGQRDTQATVNALLPTGPVNENVPTPQMDSQASMRVTHDFSAAHRLQIGYNFEYGTNTNSGVGGLTLPEAGTDGAGREDDLIFNYRIIVTPNLINQLLVTFEKDEDVTRSVTNAQAIQVSGAFTGGGAQADVSRTENTVHINEAMSWSHGRHYVRFGVQLPQFSRRAVDDQTDRLGTFGFASLANYAGSTPYVFTAQQGTGRGIYWANEVGAFVQDQIAVNKQLQVSFGVRYSWQTYVSDDNNLAPRGSIAYAPGKGKTILRLGSGIFHDRIGGDFPSTFKLHNGIVLDSVQLQNPSYPLTPGATFAAAPSSLVLTAAGIRSPYTIQSSVSVERQLRKKITVTAGYRSSVQVKSFRSRDANAPILPPNPSLTADYARPNPSLGQVQQIESTGRQMVNALDLNFRGDLGRWFSGQAQYTLSRAESNTGGTSSFPQDQYHPNAEWGRIGGDRLHAFNLIGEVNPEHWLSVGINLGIYSGTPYTETTGTDDFHTGLDNARPAGVGRNTLQAAGQVNLDLSWDHDFALTKAKGEDAKALSAGVSAFNVLNHANYVGYVGAVNSPLFGRPTGAQSGRQMQLSVGYRF